MSTWQAQPLPARLMALKLTDTWLVHKPSWEGREHGGYREREG